MSEQLNPVEELEENTQIEPSDEGDPHAQEGNEDETDDNELDGDDATQPEPTGTHKKLSRTERIERRYADRLKAQEEEIAFLRSIAKPQAQTPAPVSHEKPKLADYDSVDDYVEAREQYLKAELLAETRAHAAQAAKQSSVMNAYEQKVTKAKAEVADWDEVLEAAADEPTAPETVQFCLDSDVGPKIAYYLAKNPAEHERINKLSPLRRVAELGKMEERLKTPTAKKATSAPTKMTDVKGQGTPIAKRPGDATSYTEWKALQAKVKRK